MILIKISNKKIEHVFERRMKAKRQENIEDETREVRTNLKV